MNPQRKSVLSEALQRTLAPGETLIWTGYPRTGTYILRDLIPPLLVPCFLLFVLPIGLLPQIVVPTYSDWIALPNEHDSYFDYLFTNAPGAIYCLLALITLPFVLSFIFLIHCNSNLSRTMYAVSNCRTLSIQKRIVSQPNNHFKILERKADDFHHIKIYKRADQSGSVGFETNRNVRKTNGKLNSIYAVDNIDKLEAILNTQFGTIPTNT